MKNYFLFLTILFIPHKGISADEPIVDIKSIIKEVTVFLKGAQITRTASITLNKGTTNLKFVNISPDINAQSIQVEGGANFKVLSVVHQLNYLNNKPSPMAVSAIESKKRDYVDLIILEESMLDVFVEEEDLILKNKNVGGNDKGVSMTELKELADFYRSRLREIKLEKIKIKKKIDDYNAELKKLNQQLDEIKFQNKNKPTSEITITVSVDKSVTIKPKLIYLTKNAGWIPTYDVRVTDVESPINLIYKANVFQNSGENWDDIELTLSTANPSKSATKPVLNPWYLANNNYYKNKFMPRYSDSYGKILNTQRGRTDNIVSGRIMDEFGAPLPGVSVVVKGTTTGTVTNIDGEYELKIPEGGRKIIFSFIGYNTSEVALNDYAILNYQLGANNEALEEVVVTADGVNTDKKALGYSTSRILQGKVAGVNITSSKSKSDAITINAKQTTVQTNVEFETAVPYDIPTDGKKHIVNLEAYEFNALYQYSCIPKISTDAYLVAKVTEWEKYNLIGGYANLFFEGKYIGKSYLDVENLKDTLDISLGVDQNVVVERKKIKDFSSEKLIGGKVKLSRAWEINVRNKKSQPINIFIEDQYPISQNKEIEVEKIEHKEAQIEETSNKVTWAINLLPNKSKEINFRYAIKYPKNVSLVID